MYVWEKGTHKLLSCHLFLWASQKEMQYLRYSLKVFTEVFKFLTTISAMLILTGLRQFAEGWNSLTFEDRDTSQAMQSTASEQVQRLDTVCKCEERSDTLHTECMSLKPHWKHTVLSTLWKRWNSGITEVQFANRSQSHQPPCDSFAHTPHWCPCPIACRSRPKNQKGRCIFAVNMDTVMALVWSRTAFPCLQRLRYKYSHFH